MESRLRAVTGLLLLRKSEQKVKQAEELAFHRVMKCTTQMENAIGFLGSICV